MVGWWKMFENREILVWDLETDSLDTNIAKIKWFGGFSYLTNEYYLLPFKGNEKEIEKIIKNHKIHIGFNLKEFDNPILQNNFNDKDIFNYKVIIDLLEISAPKTNKDYGFYRKNRLAQMGIKLKSFSLRNIVKELKLDDIGKGDIDYNIFKKDEWSIEEIEEIKKYLKQDIDLTKKLFEWFHKEFEPLMKFLPQKDQDNFFYIKSSLSSLAYSIICNKAGLNVEYGEKTSGGESYAGGHHIESRWDIKKGNIIEIDFTSAYPHAMMMGNLYSFVKDDEEGWNGDGYYLNLQGKYNAKEQGKIELAIKDIFLERLKAKQMKDKEKSLSYKIIINSLYGCSANPIFKSIYNRKTASDCTTIVRIWMKKLAKILENNGYVCLYGFTDSIFILVPPIHTKEKLMDCVNEFLKEAISHMPFPMDTFKMEIEEEIKMIWFIAKNCYLFVTQKNEVKYKSTLFNTNTPLAVMKLFDGYMKPIIIEKLDVSFTKDELKQQLLSIIEKEPELAAQEYKVTDKSDYKLETSIQYQISEAYGPGRHFLIPNKKLIGVGLQKHSKKKRGLRYCSIDEFKNNNLNVNDIDLSHLLSHLKPFFERSVKNEKNYEQKTL